MTPSTPGTDDPTTDPFADAHRLDDLGSLDPAWAGIRRTAVALEGTDVRVLAAGPEPGGEGHAAGARPVVLVHGLGGSATNWVEVQPALATDRPVLALDLPGFGETAPPRPTTARPGAAAGFVARLLRQLDIGPVVLVGNSMGGLVATLVAGEHPRLVAGLGLIAPSLPQVSGLPRVSPTAVRTFAPFAVARVGTAVRRRRAERSTPAERYQEIVDVAVADPDTLPARVVRLGEANVARGDALPWRLGAFPAATSGMLDLVAGRNRSRTLAAIDGVTAPTLLLRGDLDRLVHANVVTGLARRRPDWEVVALPDVGHVPQMEAPTTTVTHLRTLLDRADAAG